MSKHVETARVAVMEGVKAGMVNDSDRASGAGGGQGAVVAQLVGDAQRQGLSVDAEGGLLSELTRLVLESALEVRSPITSATTSMSRAPRRMGTPGPASRTRATATETTVRSSLVGWSAAWLGGCDGGRV
jgi:hypothetical protein